jgi:hypothetical protein
VGILKHRQLAWPENVLSPTGGGLCENSCGLRHPGRGAARERDGPSPFTRRYGLMTIDGLCKINDSGCYIHLGTTILSIPSLFDLLAFVHLNFFSSKRVLQSTFAKRYTKKSKAICERTKNTPR